MTTMWNRPRRLLAGLIAVLTLAAVFTVAPARPAHAVTCYGDYCSGQDPESSGCSAGAWNVASASVYGTGGESRVDLRWSPTCKTNWARINFNAPGGLRAVQSTGYTQYYSGSNGSYWWTAMIYSPNLCVRAISTSGGGVAQTPCY